MKEFSNEDLKAGMLVELYNGTKGILIPVKGELGVYSEDMRAQSPAYLLEQSINDDIDKLFGIIKVYNLSKSYHLFDSLQRDLLWEYKEPVKTMTIAEIEAELGYKIKIVDNKERYNEY